MVGAIEGVSLGTELDDGNKLTLGVPDGTLLGATLADGKELILGPADGSSLPITGAPIGQHRRESSSGGGSTHVHPG